MGTGFPPPGCGQGLAGRAPSTRPRGHMLSPPCRNKEIILEGWRKSHLSQSRVNMLEFKFHISTWDLTSGHIIFLTKQVFVPADAGQLLEGEAGDEDGGAG